MKTKLKVTTLAAALISLAPCYGNAYHHNQNPLVHAIQNTRQSASQYVDARSNARSNAQSNAQSSTQSNTQSNAQLQSTVATGGVNISRSTRLPVATAIAPPLATENRCMGSSVAAGQGPGIGLSLGTTWTDQDCVRRLDAAFIATQLGDVTVSRALMCQKEDIRAAYEAAGISCFGIAPSAPTDVSGRTIDLITKDLREKLYNPTPVTLTRKHERDVLGHASDATKRVYDYTPHIPAHVEPQLFDY